MHWGSKLILGFLVFLFVLFCCCAFVPLFLNFFYVVGFSLFIFCNFSCLVYTGILSFYLHCFCFDLYNNNNRLVNGLLIFIIVYISNCIIKKV